GWRWAFLLNVPVGLTMLGIGIAVLSDDSAGTARTVGGHYRADYLGAALLVSGLGTLILAVVDPERRIVALPALTLLIAFAVRQVRATRPLLPVAAFRSWPVIGANV